MLSSQPKPEHIAFASINKDSGDDDVFYTFIVE